MGTGAETRRWLGRLERLLLLPALLGIATPAASFDIAGRTSATLTWSAASGPVAGYSVFVSRNGSVPLGPEQFATGTSTTIRAELGDAIVVWLEPFDASGNLGPASPPSDTLRFVPAPGTPPVLRVGATSLSATALVGTSPPNQTLTVRNVGLGTLSYRVSSNASWLTPTPATGTATAETDAITLSFSTTSLAPGTYTTALSVTDTAAQLTTSVAVALTIQPTGAILAVDPPSISVNVAPGQRAAPVLLSVRNAGTGTLGYLLGGSAPWLGLSATTGSSSGGTSLHPVSLDTRALATGAYTATLAILAPGAAGAPRMIPVLVTVGPPAVLEASSRQMEASVAFGHAAQELGFGVRNANPTPVPYLVTSDDPWVVPSPAVGTSASGWSPIRVSLDIGRLPPGAHSTTLRVSSPGAAPLAIPLTVHVRPPAGDLDGDGSSELFLWSRSQGSLLVASHVLGPQPTMAALLGGSASDWELLVSGDFDADGRSDLLWRRRTDGATSVCLMDGTRPRSCGTPIRPAASWALLGAADLNGDGRTDVLFRDPATGVVQACFMNGLTSPGLCAPIASYPTSWRVLAGNDRDGDGRGEIAALDPATGQLRFCGGVSLIFTTCSTTAAPRGADLVATGDYDGDGRADLLWLERSPSRLTLGFPDRTGAGALRALGTIPTNADLLGSFDLDGDGKAEIGIRDPVSGAITVWIVDAGGLVRAVSLGVLQGDLLLGGSSPVQ